MLITHPRVLDAAVFGIPDESMGQSVKAVVQTVDATDATDEFAAKLMTWLRERLAHLKCPRSISFEAQLPRSDAGKLYKHELVKKYSQRLVGRWGRAPSHGHRHHAVDRVRLRTVTGQVVPPGLVLDAHVHRCVARRRSPAWREPGGFYQRAHREQVQCRRYARPGNGGGRGAGRRCALRRCVRRARMGVGACVPASSRAISLLPSSISLISSVRSAVAEQLECGSETGTLEVGQIRQGDDDVLPMNEAIAIL